MKSHLCALLALSVAFVGCAEPSPVADAADSAPAEDGYTPSDAIQTGTAILGQHPTEVTDPASFEPLEPGSQIDLVFGLQGLYMAVLGLQTGGRFEGAVRVTLRLTSGDTTVAEVMLDDLRTVRNEDGFDYLWELRLIIDGDIWRGKEGALEVEVIDIVGNHYSDTWDVVIGAPNNPAVCEAPTLPATTVDDHCSTAPGLLHRLDPGGPVDGLHLAPGFGKTSFSVVALRSNDLMLWTLGPDVNPPTAHHQELTNPAPWTDAASPAAGPWALAVENAGPTLLWGSGDGNAYAVRAGGAVANLGEGRPIHAFEAPDGYKVLLERGGAVTVHTFSPADEELSTHFVVNMSKASGPLAPTVEGNLIVVTFPGLMEQQPMWYQTASIFGGQCSLPAPMNLELGADAIRRTSGLSYGLPLLAVTRPGLAPGCADQHRVIIAPLSGNGGLDARSAVGFERGVQIVAADAVAGVVGLAPTVDGWRLVSQWVDMKAKAPGAVGVSPEIPGSVPAHWAVARQVQYAMAYSDVGGTWVRRFCFEPESAGATP